LAETSNSIHSGWEKPYLCTGEPFSQELHELYISPVGCLVVKEKKKKEKRMFYSFYRRASAQPAPGCTLLTGPHT
jgi:hypothetical protein